MTSHKPLKSVSHNFGHSFISLMNYIDDDYFLGHLLKQARKTKCNKLTVDILKNIAEPTELLTDQIKSSIEHWNKWFPTLVEGSGSTMDFVSSATMTIEFDLQQTRPYSGNNDYLESPFMCEIVIVDDRKKKYKHKHEGWWFPETKYEKLVLTAPTRNWRVQCLNEALCFVSSFVGADSLVLRNRQLLVAANR